MRAFTLVLALFCLTATLLPFIQSPHWWIRYFDFPRAQIAVLCLVALGLVLAYVRRSRVLCLSLAGLLALALGYQLRRILVYTPFFPVQARPSNAATPDRSFRLMISNVYMKNRQAEAFKTVVREADPDLLLVNEPDAWWARQLQELHQRYPYRISLPLDNTYGMMLFSRLPLPRHQVRFLVHDDVPSFWVTVRLPSGDAFDLYCLHPHPPKPGTPSYERDAELLLVGRHVYRQQRPAVVAGDMNDVAWSHTAALFQRYSGLLDPREGRGLYNTYHAQLPFLRYPLDHIYYSHHFGLTSLRRLPAFGSDHFAMLAELSYEPHTRNAQDAPKRQPGTRRDARQRIQRGTTPE